MWGHLCTELSNLHNFNVGFSTHKSEILLHLSQWQYWWWFWFSFFWTFYFFVIIRVIKHRTFKMDLRVNTSLRSRGKWGDYLVTIIPISWCLNILLNSNFILRMIEWQAEAGTLIIRIHGKQWYWVYKYDLQNVFGILSTPKSIGTQKWVINNPEGSANFNTDLQRGALKIAKINQTEYWDEALNRDFNPTSTTTLYQNNDDLKTPDPKTDKATPTTEETKTETKPSWAKNRATKFFPYGGSTKNREQIAKEKIIAWTKQPRQPTPSWAKKKPLATVKNKVETIQNPLDRLKKYKTIKPFTLIKDRQITKFPTYDSKPLPVPTWGKKVEWNNITKQKRTISFAHIKNIKTKEQFFTLAGKYRNQKNVPGSWKKNVQIRLPFKLKETKNTKVPSFEKAQYMSEPQRKALINKLFNKSKQEKKVNFIRKIPARLYKASAKLPGFDFFKKIRFDGPFFNRATRQSPQSQTSFYENNALDDDWENYSNVRSFEGEQLFRILPTIIATHQSNDEAKKEMFRIRFLDTTEVLTQKPEENIEFLVVKQKRYKRKQGYKPVNLDFKNPNESPVLVDLAIKPIADLQTTRFLKNNLIFKQANGKKPADAFNHYNALKLNRTRSETFSINLSRRLLRTTRTLVLPAYTNISIIANSYDVVHSWFIPGLGLKMDCVPGKSTHHSLYIDNVGLYYGQCAEICGRYHHHMPIRICAIPFDHFIVWWTTKGLPKVLKLKYNPNKTHPVTFTKYVW